ncbi:MAG: DUF2851 family protein [Saprospiraceae bacterium]|nr:DUF2851 family protein [Saprospiraceae bacterium]MCF8251572.1 DUF2851 family protein [Saprospiraceae bacterium]MCF8282827.1 DUF2851 family protein [Bacteroidales bacterium]MCF8313467.1 DUF2851 family protein [Saprospiraceae bacterium]MCF8442208.1 DUF2851 family protein [Saprospiraceae bacterium]
MKEDLLHFLWRTRRFEQTGLRTTEGEPLEIAAPGIHNSHAGPDFLNARLRIGGTTWAGNVEMHLTASEWLRHGHQSDAAYSNVILHVVLDEDQPILRPDGTRIPCLELRKLVPPGIEANYLKLLHNEHWIPCHNFFHTVPQMTRTLWLDRMLVERLEQKTTAIREALKRNGGDWEETFYQFLARNFGLKVNAEPFEMLARSLPQRILARHKDNPLQLEALLFGQSGLLPDDCDDIYPNQLKKEYDFLRKKYQLTPIEAVQWRFLRLHPGNFPTIRLAEFARLTAQSAHLFSHILEVEKQVDIESLFNVKLDGYWLTHYTFGHESPKRNKSLGKEAIRLFTINTIVPFLFLYGKMRGEEAHKDKALQLLEALPPERNAILDGWQRLGVEPPSAYQTQALLQLKNVYCDRKRCLECAVGAAVLK